MKKQFFMQANEIFPVFEIILVHSGENAKKNLHRQAKRATLFPVPETAGNPGRHDYPEKETIPLKFAMFGAGAAGSVFASYLRSGGADIILIDRNEKLMNKVKEDDMTFTIHLQEGGEYHDITKLLKGFRAYTSAQEAYEAEGRVDAIIYMTKAMQLEQAIADSAPVVGENTVAVSLINGLGNDDNLLKAYPADRCIIGSGVLGTALRGPGHCVCTPVSGVQMNFGAIERSELTDRVCEELLLRYREGGCNACWRKDDIYKYVWKKVIVNSVVNTVCFVLRLKIGEIEADPYGRKLFHDVIREACAIATARGTALDADDFIAHDHQDVVTNVGDYYPSMCQDAFNRRQTEIDVLNGKISDYGKELGIPTPTCDVLSTVVRAIQGNYDKQF